MPYISYEDWRPQASTLAIIHQANSIAQQYGAMGYSLTLRQLYYRFVAADIISNDQQSYNRLGTIVSKARMAGMIDWDHIEDRTREHHEPPSWRSPAEILRSAQYSYAEDLWATQPFRPEIWVEKDALVDVIGQAADKRSAPYFSCRGYTSQSAMWRAGQRMVGHLLHNQKPVIIHLGDHDPSGIDMTRDIFDRLHTFIGTDTRLWDLARKAGFEDPYTWGGELREETISPDDAFTTTAFFAVHRIALNWDQVEAYNPPPNPTKLSDSRAEGYVQKFGYESWELDALEPQVLDALIIDAMDELIDEEAWERAEQKQEENRGKIGRAIEQIREDEE